MRPARTIRCACGGTNTRPCEKSSACLPFHFSCTANGALRSRSTSMMISVLASLGTRLSNCSYCASNGLRGEQATAITRKPVTSLNRMVSSSTQVETSGLRLAPILALLQPHEQVLLDLVGTEVDEDRSLFLREVIKPSLDDNLVGVAE